MVFLINDNEPCPWMKDDYVQSLIIKGSAWPLGASGNVKMQILFLSFLLLVVLVIGLS